MTRVRRPPVPALALSAILLAAALFAVPGASAETAPVQGALSRGGESQIDESAPDESASRPDRSGSAATLPERLRDYVEGSVARYDALKHDAPGFRRMGWFPSLFLREPERDVTVEQGTGGTVAVTVDLSYARRDLEQRLVIAPAERFELPGADKRFFCELLGALATAAPEIARARLRFWFATLRADGRMTWETRGALALTATSARRFPAGARTAEAVWPLLDENTIPPTAWP